MRFRSNGYVNWLIANLFQFNVFYHFCGKHAKFIKKDLTINQVYSGNTGFEVSFSSQKYSELTHESAIHSVQDFIHPVTKD